MSEGGGKEADDGETREQRGRRRAREGVRSAHECARVLASNTVIGHAARRALLVGGRTRLNYGEKLRSI